MTKALFVRRLDGSLVPADDAGQEIVRAVKPGKEVWVDIKRARNPRRHRLFFALVSIVHKETGEAYSSKAIEQYLKILGGLVEPVKNARGEIIKTAKSIAWSKMSEEEFSAFITRLMNVICTEVIPGLPESDLKRELEAITEIKTERTL